MTSEQLNRRLEAVTKVSQKGKRVKDLHRLMYEPDLYMDAYRKIYANLGAVTKGVDDNTLDGMSEERILNIIKGLKEGVFKPKAVRRTYISKANGKKRPLGIPTGDDKLVQEVARMILERIYEPVFSDSSHGFRPNRSCHTALSAIHKTWTGVKWLIDFDIKGYFDNINHTILLKILEKRIEDIKFLRLIKAMFQAGYVEDWKYNRTYSGTPQGGIVSPILANIYLHELDEYIEDKIIKYNKGKKRAVNPEYRRLSAKIQGRRKKIKKIKERQQDTIEEMQLLREIKELDTIRKKIPASNPMDCNYKRLRYIRYADDFVLGVIGTKAEAEQIMEEIISFINEELDLDISSDKTGIRHAKEGTRFLGYDIRTHTSNNRIRKVKLKGTYYRTRTIVDLMQLHIPVTKITQFCKAHGYGRLDNNAFFHRSNLINKTDAEIFSLYNAELRGFANYYNLAYACKSRLGEMFYIAEGSLTKTLAGKYKTRRTRIYAKYRRGYDLVCRYKVKNKPKEITLFKTKYIVNKNVNRNYLVDRAPYTPRYSNAGSELIRRLKEKNCEYCGTKARSIEYMVHQVRKLSEIAEGKTKWQQIMFSRKRKTLILCTPCFNLLKSGKLPEERYKEFAKVESRVH